MSRISQFISAVGAKRLQEVEVNKDVSNQHEFNGTGAFKKIFGEDRINFQGKFIYLPDEEDKIIEAEARLTWYDARERHPTRSEHRLYYESNTVLDEAAVDDLAVIARLSEDTLLVVIVPAKSTSEQQVMWLFGLQPNEKSFIVKDVRDEKKDVGFAGNFILSRLGLEDETSDRGLLAKIQEKFGERFPSTLDFSEFARSLLKADVSSVEDPDTALISWMSTEEKLFKLLERHLVQRKLREGFGEHGDDVEEFIQFSLSVQNRRKARAGFAFENHLCRVFDENKIEYSRGKVTELNKKPDFIFPSIEAYHNKSYPTDRLTMLGIKTTAKDRWRQIISEASRIPRKYLATLEPSISANQTAEMISENVFLVVPMTIHETYLPAQKTFLMTVKDFIEEVKYKQIKKH